MNLVTLRAVAVRSLPLLAACIAATIEPSLAAQGGGGGALPGVTQASDDTQGTMLHVGGAVAICGIGFSGFHFMRHREDYAGSIGGVLASLAGGAVMGNAPAIYQKYFGGGAVLPHHFGG